jgi:hypothetical protein
VTASQVDRHLRLLADTGALARSVRVLLPPGGAAARAARAGTLLARTIPGDLGGACVALRSDGEVPGGGGWALRADLAVRDVAALPLLRAAPGLGGPGALGRALPGVDPREGASGWEKLAGAAALRPCPSACRSLCAAPEASRAAGAARGLWVVLSEQGGAGAGGAVVERWRVEVGVRADPGPRPEGGRGRGRGGSALPCRRASGFRKSCCGAGGAAAGARAEDLTPPWALQILNLAAAPVADGAAQVRPAARRVFGRTHALELDHRWSNAVNASDALRPPPRPSTVCGFAGGGGGGGARRAAPDVLSRSGGTPCLGAPPCLAAQAARCPAPAAAATADARRGARRRRPLRRTRCRYRSSRSSRRASASPRRCAGTRSCRSCTAAARPRAPAQSAAAAHASRSTQRWPATTRARARSREPRACWTRCGPSPRTPPCLSRLLRSGPKCDHARCFMQMERIDRSISILSIRSISTRPRPPLERLASPGGRLLHLS